MHDGKTQGLYFPVKRKGSLRSDIISMHGSSRGFCAQSLPPECNEVMELVEKIVNKILSKGLNHRQFRELLEEVDCQYLDFLLYNKVRRLSRGRMLERFAACLEEVKFWGVENDDVCEELSTLEWLEEFYFL